MVKTACVFARSKRALGALCALCAIATDPGKTKSAEMASKQTQRRIIVTIPLFCQNPAFPGANHIAIRFDFSANWLGRHNLIGQAQFPIGTSRSCWNYSQCQREPWLLAQLTDSTVAFIKEGDHIDGATPIYAIARAVRLHRADRRLERPLLLNSI
ncbi:hypothetical protein [Sphingosinicella rhizophila]|uniref:hypothetical protein n=1 Tax=Sphingosinicella rhizophila TaxID=3050082 RepID=UPI0028E37F09|nr:hypothetical protein [Sphingosinicella sp. GR2756]